MTVGACSTSSASRPRGKSNPQVASATKTSTATIKRWKKDPDFLSLIHGAAVLTFGHVQIRAAESDVLEHVPCEESWVWIGDGCVLAPAALSVLQDDLRLLASDPA